MIFRVGLPPLCSCVLDFEPGMKENPVGFNFKFSELKYCLEKIIVMNRKVVWITGASAGIGEALSLRYAKKGWRVVLSARRRDELERVAALFPDPENAYVLPMDVTDHEAMPGWVEEVKNHWGGVDLCILNAGISSRSYIRNTEFKVFKKLMDVNYLGTVSHALALLPLFRAQGHGQFAVLSSLMGKFSSPGRAGYSATKHALHGFFEGLRMEEHPHLHVTLICPGFVRTNITARALTGDGTPQGTIDQTTAEGVPVEKAVKLIEKAIDKKRKEVAFGGFEKSGIYIKRFFPSQLDWMVLRNRKKWEIDEEGQ